VGKKGKLGERGYSDKEHSGPEVEEIEDEREVSVVPLP